MNISEHVLGLAVAAGLLLGGAAPGWARPRCGDDAKSSWIPETDMKARISDSGYRIDIFKTTPEGCYEIYGRNRDGARVEVYFHPVTGDVVRSSR